MSSIEAKRRGLTKRKIVDKIVKIFSLIALMVAIFSMGWILYTVTAYGFKAINWTFLTNSSRPYGIPDGGIANAFLGTIYITLTATIIALPPAILGGIYLAEFGKSSKLGYIIRFTANVLMGIPSVLVGLFVYAIVVVPTGHFSGFAGSIALAIIMFPVILRTTEDMLVMVPNALREASLALGMTRARATLRIVCKAARSGLVTGVLLAVARVSGETAPLLFTALWSDAWPNKFFTSPTANMPVLITEYATNSPFEEMHTAGWGAAFIVTLLVLCINLITRAIFKEKQR